MTYDDGDALQRSWPASSSRVQARWDKLNDNDVKSIDGKGDFLVSRLQERYGYSRERAEDECQRFIDDLDAIESQSAGSTRELASANGIGTRSSERSMPSGNARAPGSPSPQSGTSRSSSVTRSDSNGDRTREAGR